MRNKIHRIMLEPKREREEELRWKRETGRKEEGQKERKRNKKEEQDLN